ncbi:MAG TPA: M28 family peptidase, partial [Vicinamibacteria bacterium]|nr:M28 family peptidase [Vicinamibacteria bacterium]
AAAAYVGAQFRAAGLSDVRLDEFEVQGVRGVNVTGVLPGTGPGLVVVGAHHDTAPESPGAYDDGGGVGVVIEVARALAPRPPPRTIVFASWDGEEAWSTGKGITTTGSRAWLDALGPKARQIVAAFVVEMSGWAGGTPVLHPIAYADPLRPGRQVIAPGWLVAASLRGARAAGAPFGVGDPWLAWLYQPAVRTFRVRLYGDDLSFLQAGVPAVFASDSSFTAFYPWYHQPADTADRLDAAALARMGEAVRGAVEALAREPLPADPAPDWFAAFGVVAPRWALLAVAAAVMAPGLLRASARGGVGLLVRVAQAGLLAALAWHNPVVALWIASLPVLVTGLSGRRAALALALLPALALGALGAVAAARGFLGGVWLGPWPLAALGLVLALSAVPVSRDGGPRRRSGARPGGRVARRGLPGDRVTT